MPAMVGTEIMRTRLMTVVAEILIGIDGEPSEIFYVTILGIIRERQTRLKFTTEPNEPATLLGWGVRLDAEDLAILRVLADANEALVSRQIGRALDVDEEASSLRHRLSPKGKLRTGGFISHSLSEGYSITEKGLNALPDR